MGVSFFLIAMSVSMSLGVSVCVWVYASCSSSYLIQDRGEISPLRTDVFHFNFESTCTRSPLSFFLPATNTQVTQKIHLEDRQIDR